MNQKTKEKIKGLGRRLWSGVRFLAFGVVFAILPFYFVASLMASDGYNWSYPALIGNGQLYLVCFGISAAALGDLLSSDIMNSKWRWGAAVGCLLFVCCSAFNYGASADIKEVVGSAELTREDVRLPGQKRKGTETVADLSKRLTTYKDEENERKKVHSEQKDKRERTARNSLFFFYWCVGIAAVSVMLTDD